MPAPTEPQVDPEAFLLDSTIQDPPAPDSNPNPPANPEPSPDDIKKKKEKTEQLAELRRAKDKAEKEAAELKKELENISKLKHFDPIKKYLEDKYGEVSDETVNKFIEKSRERKKRLNEVETTLQEKEKQIEEISIDHSRDWHESFIKPINKAKDSLYTQIAVFDKEKKNIRHPELFNVLVQNLIKTDAKGNPLSGLEIKALLTEFEDVYKQKTGEEWPVPNIAHVVENVENLVQKLGNAAKARSDWSKTKEEKEKERLFNEAKAHEEQLNKEITNRRYLTNKAIKEFDFDQYADAVDKDAFEENIREANNYLTGLLTRDKSAKPKQYNEMLIEMAKSRSFDALHQRFKELQEENERLREESKGGAPHGGGKPPSGGGKRVITESDDPAAFLAE